MLIESGVRITCCPWTESSCAEVQHVSLYVYQETLRHGDAETNSGNGELQLSKSGAAEPIGHSHGIRTVEASLIARTAGFDQVWVDAPPSKSRMAVSLFLSRTEK